MSEIESHPFKPWLPKHAKILMLGTFPPAPKRWCMPWYYPNFTNDMWRILGLIFKRDKFAFVDQINKTYRLNSIKEMLLEQGIAIFDTAQRIRRTKGTASDKDLEIVEPTNFNKILHSLPQCKAIITAGQVATDIISQHYNINAKHLKMGENVSFMFEERTILLYREPSSSRAFPMKIEKKAKYYEDMFRQLGIKK